VTTYLTCPAKWYFHYRVGLNEPATGELAAKLRAARYIIDPVTGVSGGPHARALLLGRPPGCGKTE